MNAQQKSSMKIKAMIADVAKNRSRFQASVQHTLVQIACHAYQHGDWTLANDLINEFDKGVRKQGVVNWCHKFMGLSWDATKQQFAGWSGKDHIAEHLEEGKRTDWQTTANAERIVKPYDVNEDIRNVIKHFNNAKKRIEMMPEEDKVKNRLDIDEALLKNFLSMVNFEVVDVA